MHLLSSTQAYDQINAALADSLGEAMFYAGHNLEAAGENIRQDDFALAAENGPSMDTWVTTALNAFAAFPEDITETGALKILGQALDLDGVYDCTRAWTAWGVGTMTADDFVPIQNDDDDERAQEISRGVLIALAHQTDSPAIVNGALDHFRTSQNWRGLEQFAMDDERPPRIEWLTEVASALPEGQGLRLESLAVLRQGRAAAQMSEENNVSRRRARP